MLLTPEPVDMCICASIRCCVVLIFAEAGGFDTELDGSCSETAGAIGRTGIGGTGALPPMNTFACGRMGGVDGTLVPDEVGGKIKGGKSTGCRPLWS